MTATQATIATLNLLHWAAPGIGWHSPRRTHDAASWEAKKRWLAQTLTEIGADVVGLQEVVSVDALADLGRDLGYPHLATVERPDVDEEDGVQVYRRSVNAVLSRRPIVASQITPRPGLAHALGLKEGRHLRREAVVADIDLAAGPVTVICLHLKSGGASVGDVQMATLAPPDEGRDDLEALSRSHAYAALQRSYEAAVVRHYVSERISADPTRPVIVLGDLNDAPDSSALRILTAHREELDETGADLMAPWRLIDAYNLTARPLRGADRRRPTHRWGSSVGVLDYILVSSALHPHNPLRAADLTQFAVHDRWFQAADPDHASDHAAVAITIASR